MKYFARSEAQTVALGRRLGRRLRAGDVVLLLGELGAGKTTFAKGVAAALGYKGRVTSPTFGLAREYRTPKLRIYHLDLYRLGADELGDVGLEDYLQDPHGVCLIEWPASGEEYLPAERLVVALAHAKAGRRVVITGRGKPARAILAKLAS